jgi:hypothetical protein
MNLRRDGPVDDGFSLLIVFSLRQAEPFGAAAIAGTSLSGPTVPGPRLEKSANAASCAAARV